MLMLFGRAVIIGKLRYYFLDRYSSLTLRVVLVSLCLSMTLISTFLFRDAVLNARLIIAAAPMLLMMALVGLVFLYRNLYLSGVLALLVSTVLADGIGTGTGTKITFTFALLNVCVLIWLFQMIVVNKKFTFKPSPANIPALLFILLVVISLIWSGTFVDDRAKYVFEGKVFPRLMTALVLIISPLTYLMFANLIRSERHIRFFVWWFIAVGGIFLVLRLGTGRVPPPLNSRGQFPTWVGVMAISQALFNKNLKWYIRLLLIGIAGGWTYVTVGLGLDWYSGWMPLGLCFAVLLFGYSRKLFILAMIAGCIFLYIEKGGLQEQVDAQNKESGSTRSEAWSISIALTKDHILFGTGPAGYALYYTTYLTGFYQLNHNNYVDIFAQMGILGLIVFLWFWVAMTRIAWKTMWLVPRGGFWHALGIALFASHLSIWLTMMLGDWITPFTYTQTLSGIDYTIWAWMITGITLNVYHRFKPPETVAPPADSVVSSLTIPSQPQPDLILP